MVVMPRMATSFTSMVDMMLSGRSPQHRWSAKTVEMVAIKDGFEMPTYVQVKRYLMKSP